MNEYIIQAPKWVVELDKSKMTCFGESVIELIRCRDCKYFIENICVHIDSSTQFIVANVCSKWGDRRTKEDGYCFMAEKRDE